MLHLLFDFIISLLVGLLIGIERERSHAEGVQVMGVRSFILFALLGTLAATIDKISLTVIISLFVFAIILFSYLRSTLRKQDLVDPGITTEIAAAITFCLGIIVPSHPLIAIVLSAVVLLVLLKRERLHFFSRHQLKTHEIEVIVLLIILFAGVIPILPDRAIDPWKLFNPQLIAILLATIIVIQFGSYLAVRLFGKRFGIAITGFIGGFISSTLIFINLNGLLKRYPKASTAIMSAAVFAIVATLSELIIILFIASRDFSYFIFWPTFIMIITSLIIASILLKTAKQQPRTKPNNHTKPINLLSVFYMLCLIFVLLMIISFVKHYIGSKGILLISFISGFFELHGVTLATALLYADQQIPLKTASEALFLAIFSSFISKFFLLWLVTNKRFALMTCCLLVLIILSGAISYYLFIINSF